MSIDINFPDSISMDRWLTMNIEKPFENIIQIDNVDYIPYYLNNADPGNKGGNSCIIKLIEAQEYDESEGYPAKPELVLKVCKTWIDRFAEQPKSQRFGIEINALLECNTNNLPNLVKVHYNGKAKIRNKNGFRFFRYYVMDYAESDMASYLEFNQLTLFDRISLCLEICESLKQLWSLGYYHRDIKPDNILFVNNQWMISDLGLINHRKNDFDQLFKSERWIGPRGWMSPESMNKFLAESMPWGKHFDCNIDHQSDIYQLGKVLWYILQGNSPEGGIRRKDFLINNDELYQTVRTMLNNSKTSRYRDIENVIINLKRVFNRMIKSGDEIILAP